MINRRQSLRSGLWFLVPAGVFLGSIVYFAWATPVYSSSFLGLEVLVDLVHIAETVGVFLGLTLVGVAIAHFCWRQMSWGLAIVLLVLNCVVAFGGASFASQAIPPSTRTVATPQWLYQAVEQLEQRWRDDSLSVPWADRLGQPGSLLALNFQVKDSYPKGSYGYHPETGDWAVQAHVLYTNGTRILLTLAWKRADVFQIRGSTIQANAQAYRPAWLTQDPSTLRLAWLVAPEFSPWNWLLQNPGDLQALSVTPHPDWFIPNHRSQTVTHLAVTADYSMGQQIRGELIVQDQRNIIVEKMHLQSH